MKNILSALFLLFVNSIFCQDIQRQMISSQGNSIAVSNGMYVSQSIGQQSLTGTSQKIILLYLKVTNKVFGILTSENTIFKINIILSPGPNENTNLSDQNITPNLIVKKASN